MSSRGVCDDVSGQRRDASAGLLFYNARYYDPTIGRFISADTMVPNPINPQDLNRFTYARNNPVRYTDPSGHICVPCVILIVALVGGTSYDYLSNPDVAYAPNSSFDIDQAPDSDLPDNDMAICSPCYYGEHGEWGMAAVAGAVELTPFDEIPGANNLFKRVYKTLPDVVQQGGKLLQRTDYYGRFNQ
jgi:RHS repeat-associated protein